MKRSQTVALNLALVAVLCASVAFAQQRPTTPTASTTEREAGPQIHKASTFIGSSVQSRDGESLGKIEDLVIDPSTGQITYAALSYGSVLGLGGKLFAVPWDSFKLAPDGKTFVLEGISKAELEESPGFDKDNWPQQGNPMMQAGSQRPVGASDTARTGTGMSSGEAMSGTIQSVNSEQGSLTLRTTAGKTVELQAPTELLSGLQTGDAVEVTVSGERAINIQKQTARTPRDMGGASRERLKDVPKTTD